jgi:hypothetical protein
MKLTHLMSAGLGYELCERLSDRLLMVGMSDGNGHTPWNLPLVLLGGATKGGRYLNYPGEPSLANLHLTLLDKLGTPIESLGDSSGPLDLLSI